jgi:hypothetical protein
MLPVVCTVVVLVNPHQVLLAANRDENVGRPWDPPAAWWPAHRGVIGGRDRTAGGTWMGINLHGVVAAVLNRPGTLGPVAGKRSRGELPLLALDHPTAVSAARAMTDLDASAWRGFNMVLADASGAWFVRGVGHGRPAAERLPAGVSMITAHDPNDLSSPRTARHLLRFEAEQPSGVNDWQAWREILADRRGNPGEQMNVVPANRFGTVCSSFVVLPLGSDPIWLFADGAPHAAVFRPVTIR